MLKFTEANAKTVKIYTLESASHYLKGGKQVYNFNLPAGYSCPFAKDCLAKAVEKPEGGFHIVDGPEAKFRCYAARDEAQYRNLREARNHNFDLVRKAGTPNAIRDLLLASIPANCGVVRYHASGDFYSYNYLLGFLLASQARPSVLFYGYTKALPNLKKLHDNLGTINLSQGIVRKNFLITGSVGGTHDHLLTELNLRNITVAKSKAHAAELGLPIDDDDSHAAQPGGNFAIVVHGPQSPKSEYKTYRGKAVA